MPKFFLNNPQEGKPLAMRGLAAGLRRLAEALENLSVHNGRVEWHGFRPRIIVENIDGLALPPTDGKSRYMVLALDSDLEYDWDDPRIRVES